MVDRGTRPEDEELGHRLRLSDHEVAELEARNGLVQFDRMKQMIQGAANGGPLVLTPEHIKELQGLAVAGLEPCPGEYRNGPIFIGGTNHKPPPHADVPWLVEEMCDRINKEPRPIPAASYAMWRLNWIHPFTNGNGRTSRTVSYLVLCSKLKLLLPGALTVPDMIARNKGPYYAALDAADAALQKGCEDTSEMDNLLSAMLYRQLSQT